VKFFEWSLRILSLILVLYYFELLSFIINYIEKYFSSDNKIDDITKMSVGFLLFSLCTFMIFISMLTIKSIRNYLFKILNKILNIPLLWEFFTDDDLTYKKIGPIFLIASLTGTFIMTICFFIYGVPPREGLIETYSSFGFLISSIFLLITILILKNKVINDKLWIYFGLILILIFELFIFGEEFSWGQRFFNWESFGLFSQYNYQNETTIHNFFNPLFPLIYPAFGLSLFITTLLLTFYASSPSSIILKLFRPHPSQLFILLIMCCISFGFGTEPFEVMFAFFSVMYCLRILICINYPRTNKHIGNHQL